jgi:cytochrome b6
LGSLAAIFPWELGDKADPFASAPAGIRPEWYFLAPFYTLKLLPSHVGFIEGELLGLLGFAVLVLGWVSLPFWGTNKQGFDRTHLVKGVAFALLAYLVTFSLRYYRAHAGNRGSASSCFFFLRFALGQGLCQCHSALEAASYSGL